MARSVYDFFRSVYRKINERDAGRLLSDRSSEDSLLRLATCELYLRKCASTEDLYEAIPKIFKLLHIPIAYCHVFLERGGELVDVFGNVFPPEAIPSTTQNYTNIESKLDVKEAEVLHHILRTHTDESLLLSCNVGSVEIRDRKGFLRAVILFLSDKSSTIDIDKEELKMICEVVPEIQSQMLTSVQKSVLSLLDELNKIDDCMAVAHAVILNHLKKEIEADNGIILAYSPYDDDFILKTNDSKIIPDKRFSSAALPCFAAYLRDQKTVTTNYSKEIKKDVMATVGRITGSYAMIIPIFHNTHPVGLIVLLSTTKRFSQEHVHVVLSHVIMCTSMLYKDMTLERERDLRKQTEALHQVAKNIFTHLDDLTNLLKEIMQEARTLTNAERCSVFLMDSDTNELVAKVFDSDIADSQEVRISATEGVAGHVVQTGKILNIKEAYSNPLFYRGVDETTGFKTRNILCFPIKDEQDRIIGAAQLCNKKGSSHFTSIDEDIARALSSYCCISIVHSLMYRDVLDAHNRVKLANELMVFHMRVPDNDVSDLVKKPVPLITSFGHNLHLDDLKLSLPRSVEAEDMPLAVISMFTELDLVQNFKIKSTTLARFVLMVRKGYRDPPYHNWYHAFSVAHFAYLALKNLQLVSNGVLDDLESFAFFVAALCHDIDHRGTSNSFQVASNSVLAALYSSQGSVMERHHFYQTMCILNTEGCNIFENVSRQEYEDLLDLIRNVILSTDIAHHLKLRDRLDAMAKAGFDEKNREHKSLLICLLMTASDLSDQTKSWKTAKRVAKMLYKEFFSQGDLEKALGRNPLEMMDRDRASIPVLQIGFIDHIVLPAFQTLQTLYPQTSCLVDTINDNREHWTIIQAKAAEKRGSITSLDIFDFIDDEEENEVNGHTDPSVPS